MCPPSGPPRGLQHPVSKGLLHLFVVSLLGGLRPWLQIFSISLSNLSIPDLLSSISLCPEPYSGAMERSVEMSDRGCGVGGHKSMLLVVRS